MRPYFSCKFSRPHVRRYVPVPQAWRVCKVVAIDVLQCRRKTGAHAPTTIHHIFGILSLLFHECTSFTCTARFYPPNNSGCTRLYFAHVLFGVLFVTSFYYFIVIFKICQLIKKLISRFICLHAWFVFIHRCFNRRSK